MTDPVLWRLDQLRRERHLGMKELRYLLERAGCPLSQPQLHRLVHARPRRLDLDVLAALLTVLDCSAHELLMRQASAQPAGKTRSGVARVRPISFFDLAGGPP